MAHILDLPGCFVRAANQDEAVRCLPDAIREYHAWLQDHAETAGLPVTAIRVEVVEEIHGAGPFDLGDVASLFAPDRRAVSPNELEDHLRLLEYSRADLLELVIDLPDEDIDWQPQAETFSVRRILRHIGNSEEWYVSRLVSPENLPAEWQDDDNLPIDEFLRMERRTAIDCLRRLTTVQRKGVFYPTRWTDHPDEPWTLRKVLRRFLEHEREHTAQARLLLASWRELKDKNLHEDG